MNNVLNLPDLEGKDIYVHVGKRLRELRMASGSTQADIAKVINVSPQQYQKYEDAQSRCSLPYLMTLADHFRVHLTDILPVEDKPEQPRPTNESMGTEADLLARLVSAFVKLSATEEKLRLVQLVEAIIVAQGRNDGS